MTKTLLEIAAEIVHAQIATGQMSPGEIESALEKTFLTLQRMQSAEATGAAIDKEPAKTPETKSPLDSIQKEKIICLECGREMRQLTGRHLGTHNLSIQAYREKYGIPTRQPLSARALTKARSKQAKKRGLPQELVEFQEKRRQEKANALPVPKPEPPEVKEKKPEVPKKG